MLNVEEVILVRHLLMAVAFRLARLDVLDGVIARHGHDHQTRVPIFRCLTREEVAKAKRRFDLRRRVYDRHSRDCRRHGRADST